MLVSLCFLASGSIRGFEPRRSCFTRNAAITTARNRETVPGAIDMLCRSPSLCRSSALEKVERKNNHCCYQQQVNQATGDKATVKPNQPEQQQHYQNSPQHKSYLLVSNVLCNSGLCESSRLCARPHTRYPLSNVVYLTCALNQRSVDFESSLLNSLLSSSGIFRTT